MKRLFFSTTIITFLILSIVFLSSVEAAGSLIETKADTQAQTLSRSNMTNVDSINALTLDLNETRVSFLLACRCTPDKLSD